MQIDTIATAACARNARYLKWHSMEAPRQRPLGPSLRICHVLEASGGGSGQVVLELARFAQRQGDDITVIYSPKRADARFVEELNGISSLKIYALPMERKIGLHDIRDAWLLWKLLRKTGPFDVIHGHSSKAGALTRCVGLFLPGPVIYTPHAFYSMMKGVPVIYGVIERLLSWISDYIVCVSLGEWHHGQRLGISPKKLCLIPNGISPMFSVTRDDVRRRLKLGDESIVCGFVGRFEPQKDPVRAVAAFSKVARRFPNARMVMVGNGVLRAEVEAEIRRHGIDDRVMLLGGCNAREIIPGFDCLIGSSEYEALPISFIESLSAGAPIITTPVGGVKEAVIEGKTGYAASAFTADALGDALALYLAGSSERKHEMAACSKEHAKNYSRECMGEKYRDLYCRVCHKDSKTLAPVSEASAPF